VFLLDQKKHLKIVALDVQCAQSSIIVTEHGVIEQWSYADSNPDFCTVI
jgi:hypothetical protein